VEVRRYISVTGRDHVGEWIRAIRDPKAKAAIAIRMTRLSFGNAGDSKSVGDGVQELRIDIGVGYRLYYARVSDQIVLLLCGGDKRRQSADVMRAKEFLLDYKHRSAAK
jgi:putative addiction module killer protein